MSIDRERLTSVRERHRAAVATYPPGEFGPGTICSRCQEAWPCDAVWMSYVYEAEPGDSLDVERADRERAGGR